MELNPWSVDSIESFSFYCCPECIFRSKEENFFQIHALQNHVQSKEFFQEGNDESDVTIKEEVLEEVEEFSSVKLEIFNDMKHLSDSQNEGKKLYSYPVCNDSFDTKMAVKNHLSFTHEISSDRLSSYGCISHETQTPTYLNFTGEPKTRSVENGLEHEDPVKELHNNDINVAMGILDKKESDFQDENENFDCRSENESYESLENDGNFSSSSLTDEKEKVILSYSKREEVLTKIGTERDILFGKVQDGISKKQKDKCRNNFLKWCQKRGISYKTWGKVYENYSNWKRDWKRNQLERKKQNGLVAQPQEKWEQLLEICESKDLKMDQEKKNQLKQLKLNRSSLTEDKVRDEKVIISCSQREEVLTKIVTEKAFLFGKIKDGISWQQKDKCRDDFLKWCQLRGIPYKKWGRVYEHYFNWKRDWKRIQFEREKQAGSGAQPQEKWEQLLGLCESKDLEMDPEKKNQFKKMKLNKSSLTEDKVKIEKVILSQKKFKPETVENDSKEGVIDNGKDEVQCKNCGKQLKDQKTYRSHQRYYQGKCKPSESLDRPRYGYDPGICPHCGEHFNRLQQHILYKHTTEKPFKCQKCDFAHALEKGLNGHMRTVHPEKSALKICHICSFKAVTNQQLRIHVESKHDKIKNIECPHEGCELKFYARSAMKNHFKNLHSNERPYKCEICGDAFSTTWKLKRHMERVHEGKKYYCETCGAEYASPKSLKKHKVKQHGMDKKRKFKFDDV